MKLLFLGDIYAKPGRTIVKEKLLELREKYELDFVVANGENAAAGLGITPDTAQEIYNAGVDVITLGNHAWDKNEILDIIDTDRKLIRPANYPPGVPGRGFHIYDLPNGKKVAVMNLMCRLFMEHNLDCPFQYSRNWMKDHRLGEDYHAMIVDVHGETTSEKACLGAVWNGRASLVVGSHTHVPTADARILSNGTGFQSDAGMCGPYDSVIGVETEIAVSRFEKKGRIRIAPAKGEGTLCGTYIEVDDNGLCQKISPVRVGGTLSEQLPG